MIDRLYCENFRSIEKADLTFDDGVTVIIGKNGSGKSTLIEAILWVLYAKQNKGSNKEDLKRDNAPEDEGVLVSLDFTTRDAHYRVRRQLSKRNNAAATLYRYDDEQWADLQKRDPADANDDLGVLIATGASATTKEIPSILGVDYEGFKASFVAQQKELDSFAGLAPENRKRFFLGLLGYDPLDKMKKTAKGTLDQTTNFIAGLKMQNMDAAQISKDIEATNKDLATIQKRIANGQKSVDGAKAKADKARADYSEIQVLSERYSTFQGDITKLEQEKSQIQARISELAAAIEESKSKTAGFDPNVSISDQLHEAKEKSDKAQRYREKLAEMQRMEQPMREKLEAITQDDVEIARLTEATKTKPNVDDPMKKVAQLESRRNELYNKVQDLKSSESRISGLIESAERGDVAKCPTCGSSVSSDEGKAHLRQELDEIRTQIESVTQEGFKCKDEIETAKHKEELARRAAATYDNDVHKLTELRSNKNAAQAAYDDLAKQVKEKEEEAKALEQFKLSDKEKISLDERIIELTQLKAREDEMRKISTQMVKDEQELASKNERLSDIISDLAEKTSFIKSNKTKVEGLDKKKEKADEADSTYERYQDALMKLRGQEGALNAKLEADKGNLEIAEKREKEIADLNQQKEDQNAAVMVIETLRKNLPEKIAPRLSEIASNLLSIATNGKYSMLEINDDYNIWVQTDSCMRVLDQMSGGEKDIITLCVRIAVSQILLEASGMGKQTMILDEIFGALDDERRMSTVQALRNIRNVIPRILCITHIDEIKDISTCTYLVEKSADGASHVKKLPKGGIEFVAEEDVLVEVEETSDPDTEDVEPEDAAPEENSE